MNEELQKKVTGLLGIARKAGKLVCGTPLVTESVRAGKCRAVILCREASANTAKRLHDSCAYYRVPLCVADIPMETLAHAVGKQGATAAVGLTDAGFAKAILQHFSTLE